MQRTQIDFLNHGLLPFVGRSDELKRILRFWRETADAPGLRALMVVGEAGIGKSRLMEEVAPYIGAEGGVVVQTKLYPDATTSLAPLVARALMRSGTAQQLLKSDPEETIPSVAAALIRICGLRPTLLVIEDLHLLTGETLHDFSALLDRLTDEPLSIICTTRPIEMPARAVLERCLVEEIALGGLNGAEITTLCEAVFGERVGEDIVQVLREKTTGNSLALRSALRAGLRPGGPGSRRGGISAHLDAGGFIRALDRNVRLLSEGMVAHLSEREKEAAECLAMLGEVFAREAAEAVLENAEGMLEVLTFKGIVTTSGAPPPAITDAQSAHPPLVFTHSLLHRHFVDQGRFDPNTFVRLLAGQLPLYSLLPFPMVREHAAAINCAPEIIRSAITSLGHIHTNLDNSRNWTHGVALVATSEALSKAAGPLLEEEARRELEAAVLVRRLTAQRRAHDTNYPELVERFLALSENPCNVRWGELRLSALVFQRRMIKRRSPEDSLALWSEVEKVIAQFPELRFCHSYVSHLRESVVVANTLEDTATSREVERQLRHLLDDEETTEEFRYHAWRTISPHMLTLFSSQQELDERLRQLGELEASRTSKDADIRILKIGMFFLVGYFDRVTEQIEAAVPLFREIGFQLEVLSSRMIGMFADILINGDTVRIPRELRMLLDGVAEQYRRQVTAVAPGHFASASMLVGDLETARSVLAMFVDARQTLQPDRYILFTLLCGDIEAVVALGEDPDRRIDPFRRLLATLADGTDADAALVAACETLRAPVLTTHDLFNKQATIELITAIDARHPAAAIAGRARDSVRAALLATLEWLAERTLPIVMRPVVDRYEEWLSKSEVRTWRAQIAALGRQREEERIQAGTAQRLRLSLFGAIAVQGPDDDEPTRIRGQQLCALLGAMAADRILAKPLSASEFSALVYGNDRDPDSVRKSMNFAVFRLREILGSDAVSTAGDTPALNLELIDVDIVIAHQHLRAAADAVRDGALVRALPELMAALKISDGQVPFPTLYDEFFEAAREDFESELRNTTIRLARALNREGDSAAAEEVLRFAFTAMPDDEEIAELLQRALVAVGKRTEARRIGMVAEAD